MDMGRVIEDAMFAMVCIGIAIGIGICGLVWLAWWLFKHISLSWI